MRRINKMIYLPISFLLGATLILGGCTAAKKPLSPAPGPQAKPTPTTPAPTTPKSVTPAPAYPKEVSNRIVNQANTVNGVRGSYAVVSGKNIYLGLDLQANLEKNKSAEVEKTVLNKVKNIEPGYTVTVSSDIDTVTRIKKVAQGIAQGQPVSSFTKEIQDIATRIIPKTK